MRVDSLRGLGDRWEREVARSFGKHRQNYRLPTAQEREALERTVRLVREGLDSADKDKLDQACDLAEPAGYSLQELRVPGKALWLLAEREPRGWGLAVFRPPSPGTHPGLIVEVPHPVADRGTPELGLRAFDRLEADTFLLAGAHRSNRLEESPDVSGRPVSDVTHTRDTVFQAMHRGAARGRGDVLQVHGFSAEKGAREVPGFSPRQQIVLSDGADDGVDPPRLRELQQAFTRAGYHSRVVTFQDAASSRLSADTNVQAEDLRARHLPGEFVHLEVDSSLRDGADREEQMDQLVGILAQAWPRPEEPGVKSL